MARSAPASPASAASPDTASQLESLPLEALQQRLGSSAAGLSAAEARARLAQYGPNELEHKKANPLLLFLGYFWGPIPWMIEAAVILSALAGHWPDFAIILVLLLANAVVGFWEEHQAGNAVAALEAKLALEAKVLRDGRWLALAARETARELGLGPNILDAAGLGGAKVHETAQAAQAIEAADGFAQVFPEHKFHIVDVLQQRGHLVGMTGDGVNDAPALKKADCGIAVSGATDAARAAASIVLLTPGLSVIIEAVEDSRNIFQRMNSYAIHRIAETLRVLLFMTLDILIFDFYPLTAVMIVMLALFNDGAILSIAYDRVHAQGVPEVWNMQRVLGVATVLGVIGPVASFGLFYLGERVYLLEHVHLQSMMYLMLSVAGHLTVFLARTRGPFWSIRPAPVLWLAVLGTQILVTLIAVYGILMPPLGWGWAGFVWTYAIAWFLVSDRLKLLAYKLFDPAVPARPAPRPAT